MQAHGGTVHFDSSVEQGTTVTVTVPATTEAPEEAGYSLAPPYYPAGPYPADHYPAGGLPPEAPAPPPVSAGWPGRGQAGQPPG